MRILRKFWVLLDRKQRIRAGWLLFLMLIGMLLEMMSLGLVVPVIGAITQDLTVRYPLIKPWLAAAGNPTQLQLIIAGMLCLLGVYAIKTLFMSFLAFYQGRFIFGLRLDLSQRLFRVYLCQPYIFHLQQNTGPLIQNVTAEVSLLTNALQGIVTLLTDALILVGITFLLTIVEPVGSLFLVCTLSLSIALGYNLVRTLILRWGKERQSHEGLCIQHLQQGLAGVKEIQLSGRQEFFLDRFRVHHEHTTAVYRNQFVLQQMPRHWLEMIALSVLTVVVIATIQRGINVDDLLSTIGIFVAAAFRMMPSVNRMMIGIQSSRFVRPVIEKLSHELSSLTTESVTENYPRISFRDQLTLVSVGYQYPGVRKPALRDINLTIPIGASIGFIGSSGAGKSTLVDLIMGLLTPTEGRVIVDGEDIQSNLRGWQDLIGYVPQSIFLMDDTMRCNIAFGIPNQQIDDVMVREAARAAQMETFIDSLPDGFESVVGERGVRLSGGQCQRIGIARALYHNPKILVLDEATSSLDSATEQSFMEAVRALKGRKTILIVAHRLSTVAHCDCQYRLEHGEIEEAGHADSILSRNTAQNLKVI